ncbi:helix-turn-helix domain-containing protein [Schlesneria sp.]|uniref:helix-turn-helix domain-containing protein n=1 Tax=Schlesneria sp. TaxID=2762018 RepID=UPI002EEAB866
MTDHVNQVTDASEADDSTLNVSVPKAAAHVENQAGDQADYEEDFDGDSEEQGSIQGDLTPNDIFGLDPLDVLTLEELADYLKVSTSAVHRMMKEQKLPGRNFGGDWRFLRDAVANWLRCQEAPAQEQKKAREDYSKSQSSQSSDSETSRFSRPPQRSYQDDQSGGEYRSRQRFSEGSEQYGKRSGGQYGSNQYGSGQYGSGGYGSGGYGGGQYGGGQGGSGNYGSGGYSPPPRRQFRSGQEGGGSYGSGGEGGYGGGRRFGGGGGYSGGDQQFGGPKRKNKRQVFDNERGKRLDRRRDGDSGEGLPGNEE